MLKVLKEKGKQSAIEEEDALQNALQGELDLRNSLFGIASSTMLSLTFSTLKRFTAGFM
jgi:hypothetical protein